MRLQTQAHQPDRKPNKPFRMHPMSVPPAPPYPLRGLTAFLIGILAGACSASEPASSVSPPTASPITASPITASPITASPSPWPRLTALGVSVSHRPTYSGSADSKWGLTPQFVLKWGRLTLSNGSTLASQAGEPAESGLSAELFSRDRLSLRAALRLDEGRDSSGTARLRGVHDVPAHVRGRVQVGWRLHPQWELLGVWRSDVSGRGTGHSTEAVLLHEWRPEFLDHRRWRVSAGVATQWRNATQSRLLYGITPEDAQRTAYPVFEPTGGFSDARLFANWRRQIDTHWVAYGGMTAETLVRQVARSPLVDRPHSFTVSMGVGRRF